MPTLTRLLFRPAWPVVLLVLLSLAAAPAQGQIDRWGVKAGVTAMTAGGEGLVDDGIGRTTGFLVGGTTTTGLVGPVSLRAEFLFLQKGWTASFRTLEGEMRNSTVTLDYLELPVLADVAVGSVGGITGRLHAGPTVGVRVRSGVDPGPEGGGADLNETTNRTLVGLALGGSASGSIGAQALQLDVRYQLSLTNVNDRQLRTSDGQTTTPTIRLRGLSVAVGVVF